MRKLIALALACMSLAAAKSVSLPSLLIGEDFEKSKISYWNEFNFYLLQPTRSGRTLTTETAYFGENENALAGFTGVRFIVKKPFLFSDDLTVLKNNINRVVASCFNISSERNAEIMSTLDKYNQLPSFDVDKKFGPLQMTLVRRPLTNDNQVSTLIVLAREGTPGRDPWKNYCTR